MRKLGHDRAHATIAATAISPRAQNIQFNWMKLRDVPDILADARRRRDALRSRPRAIASATSPPTNLPASPRTRSSDPRPWAELIRQWSTPPSGIQLPAAQVQDRGDRRRRGPRGDRRARHRAAASCATTAGEIGYRGAWSAAGTGRTPMVGQADPRFPAAAEICSPISRRCCASRTATAGATTSTRRGSRSSSTSSAPRSSRARSRRSSPRIAGREIDVAARGGRPHRRLFRAARLRRCRPTSRRLRGGEARPGFRPLSARTNVMPHKAPGYAIVDGVAEADRRHSGRRHGRADRAAGRSRRALLRSTNCASPMRRTSCCRMCSRTISARLWQALDEAGLADRQSRPDHRHHRLPGAGLLQPRQRPLDPDRAGDRASASPIPSARR